MAYRELEDVDNRIIAAIQYIGAREGALKVTARKVGEMCDVSNFTVHNHFGTKRDFLDAAAAEFEGGLHEAVRGIAELGLTYAEAWGIVMNYCLDHPDGTQYYISYKQAFGYDTDLTSSHAELFLKLMRQYIDKDAVLSDERSLLLWFYLNSMLMKFADLIIRGQLPRDEETFDFVRKLAFDGAFGVLS